MIWRAPVSRGETEDRMAVEGDAPAEIKAHASGYSLFVALMKWGAIISFILAAIVVLIIS